MVITSLVENTTKSGLKAKHGLSLYIETKLHRILFDLGPDETLFENAEKKKIDLTSVDTVIISHGHYDHGGALGKFLKINSLANIYVQQKAFEPHYSKRRFFKIPVGIDQKWKTHRQVVLLDGDYKIDEELSLFTVDKTENCYSSANDVLYDKNGRDTFSHEQNLIITEERTAVVMGCGHAGVVNIMEKAEYSKPCVCIGGFHLFNPIMKTTVSNNLLDEIAGRLQQYKDTQFYTCHCTGKEAYQYLARKMDNLHYMACGDRLEV